MPSIHVDRAGLDQATFRYLQTPEGQKTLREFDLPDWMMVMVSGFQVLAGSIQLLTIYWLVSGLKNIWKGITLAALREEKREARERITKLKPLVCHGIYGNPQVGLGLVLGSFSPEADETRLAATARKLASLYTEGSEDPRQAAMVSLLKDDIYEANRRRELVEPYNRDPQAFLFDAKMEFQDGVATPWRTVLHLFLGLGGDRGQVTQIPWSVAEPYVTIVELDETIKERRKTLSS